MDVELRFFDGTKSCRCEDVYSAALLNTYDRVIVGRVFTARVTTDVLDPNMIMD